MDYKNCKIYKIESHSGDKVYIGSTTKQYLSQRMAKHRQSYKVWKDGGDVSRVTVYGMFDEYGLENCDIILLENCDCHSVDELRAREAHYIKSMNCVNKVIPLRTDKEYRDANKVHKKEYDEIYRRENKDKKRETDKAYRESHQDELRQSKKEYREANLDSIKAKKKRILRC